MSYTKGTIKIGVPSYESDTTVIYLPHSCDEWVIGREAEARHLIHDLQEAIGKLTRYATP